MLESELTTIVRMACLVANYVEVLAALTSKGDFRSSITISLSTLLSLLKGSDEANKLPDETL